MPEILPIAEEIKAELTEIALDGDLDVVSERLNTAKRHLQNLIQHDPEAIDLIKAARAEYEIFLRLRAELLASDAIDTLEKAMGEKLSKDTATTAVRAAESILDRTLMPKVTRQSDIQKRDVAPRALPDLNDLVEQAGSSDQAHQVVDQYRDVVRQIDAMRQGAKEVIEGEVAE